MRKSFKVAVIYPDWMRGRVDVVLLNDTPLAGVVEVLS